MTESDDWDELNRELGVDKPAPRADGSGEEPDAELPEAEPFAEDAEADEAGEAEGEAGENGGAEGEPGEGAPGTGRKRRRRRRRKKKGPADGAAPVEGGEPADVEAEPVAAPAPRPRAVPAVVPARAAVEEYADAGDEEAAEGEGEADETSGTLAAEEDAGGELLRDLIAGWDVPAWDQIIGGLHRPGR